MVDISRRFVVFLAGIVACATLHANGPTVRIYPIHTTIGTPIEYFVQMPQISEIAVSPNTAAQIQQTLQTAIHVESISVTQNQIRATLIPFALGPHVIPSITTNAGVIPSQTIDIIPMRQTTGPQVSTSFLTTHQTPYPHAYWQLNAPAWLLALFPILLARRSKPYSLPKPLHYIVALPGNVRALMPALFRVGLSLLVLGLAHPVYYVDQPIHTQRPNHVMIVLDTSQAMQTLDFKPNDRLKTAQQLLDDWLSSGDYDQVGLIALGAHPYTVVPLTQDHSLVKKAIGERRYNDAGSPPNIGLALAMAMQRLAGVSGPKRIVLLTSGSQPNSNNDWDPSHLARLAKHAGIAIDTIGFGSPKGGVYQIIDNPTYTQLYRRDANNAIVSTYRNDRELTTLSHQTHGHAFHLNTPLDAPALVESLRALTLPQRTLSYQTHRRSFQLISLSLGALLGILSVMIQWRRPWGHY